ncbi:efflux transporter outer membrane subunit [Herbaspirillum sp. NPDC087042]|uniref:efflux transporter outer membrane subunit n=1 Tax=Herbaspirillum sp. NPDC087042 TaxID=3364004 RepID=UPI0038306350
MPTSKWILGALSSALLSACATVPDYHTPAPLPEGQALPARYAHAPTAPVQEPEAVQEEDLRQWWSRFQDPVLDQIIERVLAQNLDLQAALARVQQARAVAGLADAALLPSGSVSAQAARERQSLRSPLGELASHQPGYQRNQTLYDLGAGASWEADLFGGLHRQRDADQASAEAAAADGLGVRVAIAAEAADAYFSLRGAQARLAITEEEIATDTRLSELVALRLQDGLDNRRELALAQAQLASARAALTPLRTVIELQRNRLDVLMGQVPSSSATTLTGIATPIATAPALSTLPAPAALLRRRPDVMAAERRLAASHARIGVAMAEYYPKLSLSGLLGFESLSSLTLSGQTFQPLAVAGLRWRLFDFGRVDAEVAQARGANAEALARFRQAMLKATEDVENALVTETQLDERLQALRAHRAATAEALEAARDAFEGGTASQLDVLQQQRQLLDAGDQLALAQADAARASVGSFRALGGGW